MDASLYYNATVEFWWGIGNLVFCGSICLYAAYRYTGQDQRASIDLTSEAVKIVALTVNEAEVLASTAIKDVEQGDGAVDKIASGLERSLVAKLEENGINRKSIEELKTAMGAGRVVDGPEFGL